MPLKEPFIVQSPVYKGHPRCTTYHYSGLYFLVTNLQQQGETWIPEPQGKWNPARPTC